jgi:hypothetical protein
MSEVTEQQTTYISAEMRAAVGREVRRAVSYPVSESDIRRWAIAVYYPARPPRRFWEAEAAAASRYGGIVAPEDFNPFAWMTAEPPGVNPMTSAGNYDSLETSLGVPGPGLANILNGGIQVEYGVPMRPGDVITSVTYLAEYKERPGSLGLMLFATSRTVWTNQDDAMVKTTLSTLIRY